MTDATIFIKRIAAPVILATALGVSGLACSSSGSTSSAKSGSAADSPACPVLLKISDGNLFNLLNLTKKDVQAKAKVQLAALESSVPASLKPSVQTITDAVDKISNTDLTNKADAQKLSDELGKSELKGALAKVGSYAADTCGIMNLPGTNSTSN
ncbi:MAG: hypothetical protein JST73_05440 [Actinobacteria bacterium]|nr:hypothetical protein [Actinomycetota bacterium]